VVGVGVFVGGVVGIGIWVGAWAGVMGVMGQRRVGSDEG